MHWAIWDAMFKAQNAFEGVISNFPNRVIATPDAPDRVPAGPALRRAVRQAGHEVARLLIEPSATRDRLTAGMFIAEDDDDPLRADRARARRRRSRRSRSRRSCGPRSRTAASTATLAPAPVPTRSPQRAVAAGVITADEARALAAHASSSAQVIRVDDFAADLGASLFDARHATALQRQCSGAAHARPSERRGVSVMNEPIYIVDGARTPFLKARNRPGPFAASDLATAAGRALLLRQRFRADAARRGDPRLRRAVGRRSQHRPRGGAAHGLRQKVPGVDRDAQLRVGHAGDRLGDQQHPRGPLEPRARRRRRCAVARAAAVLGRDGGVAVANWYAAKSLGQRAALAAKFKPALSRAGDRAHEGPDRSDRAAC